MGGKEFSSAFHQTRCSRRRRTSCSWMDENLSYWSAAIRSRSSVILCVAILLLTLVTKGGGESTTS